VRCRATGTRESGNCPDFLKKVEASAGLYAKRLAKASTPDSSDQETEVFVSRFPEPLFLIPELYSAARAVSASLAKPVAS
jgi:hypothetical protein